jgi:hypothetical protein
MESIGTRVYVLCLNQVVHTKKRCMCVCVCERERERERELGGGEQDLFKAKAVNEVDAG